MTSLKTSRFVAPLDLCISASSLRARKAKTLKRAKSGVSPQFQKEHQKVRKTALFGDLSEIGGNPTFCAL